MFANRKFSINRNTGVPKASTSVFYRRTKVQMLLVRVFFPPAQRASTWRIYPDICPFSRRLTHFIISGSALSDRAC